MVSVFKALPAEGITGRHEGEWLEGNHLRFRGQQEGEEDGLEARRKSKTECITKAKRVFPEGGSECLLGATEQSRRERTDVSLDP